MYLFMMTLFEVLSRPPITNLPSEEMNHRYRSYHSLGLLSITNFLSAFSSWEVDCASSSSFWRIRSVLTDSILRLLSSSLFASSNNLEARERALNDPRKDLGSVENLGCLPDSSSSPIISSATSF